MKKHYLGVFTLAGLLCLAGCGAEPESSIFLEDGDTIVAGDYYIAAISEDGAVYVAYQTDRDDYPEVMETDWEDVEKLMKNPAFPVGISEKGELIFPKGQSYEALMEAEQEKQAELSLQGK